MPLRFALNHKYLSAPSVLVSVEEQLALCIKLRQFHDIHQVEAVLPDANGWNSTNYVHFRVQGLWYSISGLDLTEISKRNSKIIG